MSEIVLAIVIGTRPEAIKVWPVLLEAKRQKIQTVLISTEQQTSLLTETLADLQIAPDIIAPIANDSGDISVFLSRAIIQLSSILKEVNPTTVLVQGDTSTALAGAIAAHNLKIPVGHIEAGLRSGDLNNPWPEEGNRRLIDAISSFLWLPTNKSRVSLSDDQSQEVVGNTSIDALRICIQNENHSESHTDKYILVTLHRRESFGAKMISALNEIKRLPEETGLRVVFIEHPNPRVREALDAVQIEDSGVSVIKPVPYRKFIQLMANSALVVSDSGGIQEEATALGIPLLVVRDKTERHEIHDQDPNILVGSDASSLIVTAISRLNSKGKTSNLIQIKNETFGDGFAAERIIRDLLDKIDKG